MIEAIPHMSFMRFFWLCVIVGIAWGVWGFTSTKRKANVPPSAGDWIVGSLFGATIGALAAFFVALVLGFIIWLISFI